MVLAVLCSDSVTPTESTKYLPVTHATKKATPKSFMIKKMYYEMYSILRVYSIAFVISSIIHRFELANPLIITQHAPLLLYKDI